MAGSRTPGPEGLSTDPIDLDDGTMCRSRTAAPGPLGADSKLITSMAMGQCISQAYDRAALLAPVAVGRVTGYTFGEPLTGFFADLVVLLKVGPEPAILSSLRAAFRQRSTQSGWGDVVCVVKDALDLANHADECSGVKRDREVERAAEQLAEAAGILVRLILVSIVEYAWPRTKTVNKDDTAQLMREVWASKFGDAFVRWVANNWTDLTNDSRLRINSQRAGLPMVERFIVERKSPPVAITQSPSDLPTFSSDSDLVAQANTLIAAAAQGKPFCPE